VPAGSHMENTVASIAKIIHGGMMVTVVAVVAILKSVAGDPAIVDRGPRLFVRFGGLIALALAGWVIRILRDRIPFIGTDTDVSAWWRTHMSAVIRLWAIAEGVGIMGTVLWFVTADTILLVVLVGTSIALLLRLGPARWVEVTEPSDTAVGTPN
jgi:hypothetical protein